MTARPEALRVARRWIAKPDEDQAAAERRIAPLAIDGELHGWGFAVSPDERSFLYTVWPVPKSDIVLVENFR
jgi:hypothetical protein